ncbi:MAG: PIN domain-containing protein [Actinomycetota bacterium]
MKTTCFLDANIFLRFLTGDDRRKAEACRRLVQKAVEGKVALSTHPLILAEVVWVLESYYGLKRGDIAVKLDMILNTPNLAVSEGDAFAQAVELYAGSSLDLADCFAAAKATQEGAVLISYDRGFDSIEGLARVEPDGVR